MNDSTVNGPWIVLLISTAGQTRLSCFCLCTKSQRIILNDFTWNCLFFMKWLVGFLTTVSHHVSSGLILDVMSWHLCASALVRFRHTEHLVLALNTWFYHLKDIHWCDAYECWNSTLVKDVKTKSGTVSVLAAVSPSPRPPSTTVRS